MTDLLKSLWISPRHLHRRFGVELTPRSRIDKFNEECLEFAEAARPSTAPDAVAEELVDVIVTGIGVLMSLGIAPSKLESAILAVIKKNDAKSDQTHRVVNNKIVRR